MDSPVGENRHLWSTLHAALRSCLKAAWQLRAGTSAVHSGRAASSGGAMLHRGGAERWWVLARREAPESDPSESHSREVSQRLHVV